MTALMAQVRRSTVDALGGPWFLACGLGLLAVSLRMFAGVDPGAAANSANARPPFDLALCVTVQMCIIFAIPGLSCMTAATALRNTHGSGAGPAPLRPALFAAAQFMAVFLLFAVLVVPHLPLWLRGYYAGPDPGLWSARLCYAVAVVVTGAVCASAGMTSAAVTRSRRRGLALAYGMTAAVAVPAWGVLAYGLGGRVLLALGAIVSAAALWTSFRAVQGALAPQPLSSTPQYPLPAQYPVTPRQSRGILGRCFRWQYSRRRCQP